jgi:uncharacterized damage-inducible protein DinB
MGTEMTNESSLIRDAVKLVIERDLRGVQQQIAAYPDDESLWIVKPGIANSAGVLAIHVAGAMRHFIAAGLGKSGFVRDRDGEFASHGKTRDEVRAFIESAISEVGDALDSIGDEQIASMYPMPFGVAKVEARTADVLIHLTVHLAYHLGQIDYHRRLLTSDPQKIGMISTAPLAR